MHRYTEIAVALDFCKKYEATSVTIEVDNGTLNMTIEEAIEDFDNSAPGESFTLLAIHFDN
jgi:hypothetical protein